ncbi:rhodanese-like domain-containing protein [Rubritalea marina]|uniref:rhodanese-like domain-containing protein n=1 Tax=Rubritalea marina TaxID=361055 RepID=UPI00036CB575|nr:rhodanese-like domain-containing protein [Rubritalea marina]
MLTFIKQSSVLLGITLLLAGLLYLFTGPVDRRVACDQAALAADHLCLATVLEEYRGNVLWVDARDKKSYERKHMPGAILVPETDAENALTQPEVMQQIGMSGVEGQALVIYCGSDACGSSKHVAEKIRSTGFHSKVFILHGGWKAIDGSGILAQKQ